MNAILIGDLILDNYISGDVERISPEAPIPILNQTKEKLVLGGALNVSRNLKNLGNKVFSIGIVGKDNDSNTIFNLMEESGLDTKHIVVDHNSITSKKTRFIC